MRPFRFDRALIAAVFVGAVSIHCGSEQEAIDEFGFPPCDAGSCFDRDARSGCPEGGCAVDAADRRFPDAGGVDGARLDASLTVPDRDAAPGPRDSAADITAASDAARSDAAMRDAADPDATDPDAAGPDAALRDAALSDVADACGDACGAACSAVDHSVLGFRTRQAVVMDPDASACRATPGGGYPVYDDDSCFAERFAPAKAPWTVDFSKYQVLEVCDPFGGCDWPIHLNRVEHCGGSRQVEYEVVSPCLSCDSDIPNCAFVRVPKEETSIRVESRLVYEMPCF